jgi:hypothetical protein
MSHEDFAAALPPPVRGSPAVYVAKEDQSEEDKQWMREALLMAEEAFEALEVPVGSVFVRHGKIIAKGRNRTNELMNVSRLCCHTNKHLQPDVMLTHSSLPAAPGYKTCGTGSNR